MRGAAEVPAVLRIPGEDFYRDYLDVGSGEHVSLIGPTGTGKTTAAMQMLPVVLATNPHVRAVVLAMKPHKRPRKKGRPRTGDETLMRYAKRTGARIIRTWDAHRLYPRARLFILWPAHRFDDHDEYRQAEQFEACLRDTYRRGDWFVFADEVYSLTKELGLEQPLIRLWTRGRSMDAGLIAATQKPTHVPTWMWSMAQHLFLWHDPDAQARKRYGEIGGFDPGLVEQTLLGLDRYSCLYLRRRDRTMCIVNAH